MTHIELIETPYRHFYLYAKGWYKRTNTFDDLRKLVSEFSGISIEHIRKNDVLVVLGNVMKEVMAMQNITGQQLIESLHSQLYHRQLLLDIGMTKDIVTAESESSVHFAAEFIVDTYLSIISTCSIVSTDRKTRLDLGMPDPMILPLDRINTKPVKGVYYENGIT